MHLPLVKILKMRQIEKQNEIVNSNDCYRYTADAACQGFLLEVRKKFGFNEILL